MVKVINVFYIFLFCFITICCNRQNDLEIIDEDKEAENTLMNLISQSDVGTIISISKIMNNNFDTLFVFGPYTLLKDIEKISQMDLSQLELFNQEIEKRGDLAIVGQGNYLFLFKSNNQVAGYFTYPRAKGDFSKIKKYKYLMQDAIFKLDTIIKYDSVNWIYMTD